MRGHYGAAEGAGTMVALCLTGRGVGLHVGGTEFKERGGTQQILRETKTEQSFIGTNDTANGIMGYGGALTLVNGSPFEWTLSGQDSYQMDTWKWPNIAAGTTKRSTSILAYCGTNAKQERRPESMLSLERNGSQRMMLVKHTTTSPELQTSFPYLERSLKTMNSLFH
jgi:hypothetical protein